MQSKWRRLQRSADDAVSSPGRRGRGAAVRRQATRHSAARLSGDLHGNEEGEAVDNQSTWRREGGDHDGQSGEKTVVRHTLPVRRQGRRRRGTLGHARSEAEWRWL
jgi:hypothetical protein